jgi:hypothetical protein
MYVKLVQSKIEFPICRIWFFSKKNILIPNVAEKKYSDFGGKKKKI